MRSYFLFLIGFFGLFSQGKAFWIEEDLERVSRSVYLEWSNQSVQVEVTDTWKNNGIELLKLPLYQPINNLEGQPIVYVDAQGQPASVLEGKEKTEYVINLVQDKKLIEYFSFDNGFEQLLVVNPIDLVPGEETKVKYQWNQKVNFIEDFERFKLFLSDKVQTSQFDLELLFKGNLRHYVPYFSLEGVELKKEESFSWKVSAADLVLDSNFEFFLSTKKEASLSYPLDGFLYRANFFIPTKNTETQRNVLLLVDQSGSMYGNRWNRVKTLFPDILKTIGGEQNIKVGLFDEKWEFFSNDFEKNTHETQKNWLEKISNTVPTGKSNWDGLEEFLSKSEDIEKIDSIIFIGDFSDFILPQEIASWKSVTTPLLFLDFGKNKNLKLWAKLFFGSYVSLYESPFDFVELETVKKEWAYLGQKNLSEAWVKSTEKIIDIRPSDRRSETDSLIFLTREKVNQDLEYQELTAEFIPAWWGMHQIGFHLKNYIENQEFLEGGPEAITSLNQYFGLNLADDFINLFLSKNYWAKQKNIEYLESKVPQLSSVKLWNGTPFSGVDSFSSTNFSVEEERRDSKTLRIKPFSLAYFQLYRDQKNARELFSYKENISFCLENRCTIIDEDGVEEFSYSHRLFWDRPFGSHWADQYIQELAYKNIFKVEIDSDLELSENITRGDFMTWVAQYLYEEELVEYIVPDTPVFSDLPNNDLVVKSLTLLKEKNIIQGFDDDTIRPHEDLLRAEAVKILLVLKNYKPTAADYFLGENPLFVDLVSWEIPWVLQAQKHSIVKGYDDGTFRPFNTLNKAEAAKILVETLAP